MTPFLAGFFILLFPSVSAFGQSTISKSRPCNLKLEKLPEIKGLRIGMTTEELLSRYKGIKDHLSEPDAYGSVNMYNLRPDIFRLSQPERAYHVELTIFEQKLFAFRFVYGYSTERREVSEFLKATVDETKLPNASNWEDANEDEKILRCVDGDVTVAYRVLGMSNNVPVDWEPRISVELRDRQCGYKALEGSWIAPQFTTSSLSIKLSCPSWHGSYTDGQHEWNLIGNPDADRIKGTWEDHKPSAVREYGSFEIILLGDTLHAIFLDAKGAPKSSSTWVHRETSEWSKTLPDKGPDFTQSFVGSWRSSEKGEIKCVISLNANKITAVYVTSKARWTLSGKVFGNTFVGDWSDAASPGNGGKFVFTLIDRSFSPRTEYFLIVSFAYKQREIENLFLLPQASGAKNSSDISTELKAFDSLTVPQ